MKKRQQSKGQFQTHIPEPRLQQILSIIIVILIIAIEILFVTRIL